MVMRKSFFFLLMFFICCSACQNWLDEQPENALFLENALESPDDLQALLNGLYQLVHSEEFAGRNALLFAELLGGSATLEGEGFENFDNLQVQPGNNRVFELWSTCYQIINQTNLLLETLPEVVRRYPGFSQEAQNQLTGEACFLRAYTYHQLARYFCRPYSLENADSLGVPVMLTPVINSSELQYPGRSSLGEVYDQIMTDLEQAAANLSTVIVPGRVNQYTVHAMRARLYLEAHAYTAAYDEAGFVINGPFELQTDPADVFWEADSQERVWFTLGGLGNQSTASLDWAYTDARITAKFAQATYISGLSSAQQTNLESAGYQIADLRGPAKPDWLRPLISQDTLYCLKYNRGDTFLDFPLFRFTECLLIRAEAALELGQHDEAIAVINQLRQRGYLVYDSLGLLVEDGYAMLRIESGEYNQAALKKILQQDRQIELAFEGHLLFDRQRERAEIRPGITWDHPRLRLPIPQRELDTSPNLVQNPGY